MNKTVFILRGVQGSGKSTVAHKIAGETGVVCSSDEFCYDENGKYIWTPELQVVARRKCQEKFVDSLNRGAEVIVVDGVNSDISRVSWFRRSAEKAGYVIHILIVENHHGGKDIHDSLPHTIEFSEKELRKNIILR